MTETQTWRAIPVFDKRLERNNLDKNKSPHLLARALDPALALNSSMSKSKSKKCPSYFYPETKKDSSYQKPEFILLAT